MRACRAPCMTNSKEAHSTIISHTFQAHSTRLPYSITHTFKVHAPHSFKTHLQDSPVQDWQIVSVWPPSVRGTPTFGYLRIWTDGENGPGLTNLSAVPIDLVPQTSACSSESKSIGISICLSSWTSQAYACPVYACQSWHAAARMPRSIQVERTPGVSIN